MTVDRRDDGAPDVCVQRRQCRRSEDHLRRRRQGAPRELGGARHRPRPHGQHGHRLPVQGGGLEVDAGPVGHVGIVVEEGGRFRRRQVLGGREAGQQGVVPVPSVERRLGDEGVEARCERERRHDHCDRDHRAEQRGAHRGGAASRAAAQRRSDAQLGARGEPGRGSPDPPGVPDEGLRSLRQPVRRHPVGHEERHRAEHDDERQKPVPEDGPVEGHADVGIDRPDRPDRGQGGQPDGDPHRQERSDRDGAHDAGEAVGHRHGGPGPQGAHGRALLLGVAPDQAADHLAVDDQCGEGGDEPEDPEGDGGRTNGALGLRDVLAVRHRSTHRAQVGDDLVHRRDDGRLVRQAAVEMQRDVGVVRAAPLELPVSAGVMIAIWLPRAASSSWTTWGAHSTMPTSVNVTMRWGLSRGYPLKSGWAAWASVKKATGRVDPMCRPNCAAPPRT